MVLRIKSYNCNSLKSKLPIVNTLCNDCDILLLQEIKLDSHDISLLNQVHEDFVGRGVVGFTNDHGYLGPPHGGLAILWRKSTATGPIFNSFDCTRRFICLTLKLHNTTLTVFNVHLTPNYGTVDSDVDFYTELALLEGKLLEFTSDRYIIGGDFNAGPTSTRSARWNELQTHLRRFNLENCGVKLPDYSFTYLSPAHYNATSWIDHFFISRLFDWEQVTTSIDYDSATYDHMPIVLLIELTTSLTPGVGDNGDNIIYPGETQSATTKQFIPKWENCPDTSLHRYQSMVDTQLAHASNNFTEMLPLAKLVDCMTGVAKESIPAARCKKKIIPGWNDYVKAK